MPKKNTRQLPLFPSGGVTPQGKVVAETPSVQATGSFHSPMDAYGLWLGDPDQRYGRLGRSVHIPTWVKLEMLRDPIIAYCQAFLTAALVSAKRVVECRDEGKRKFFEAMFKSWEAEYVLYSALALAMGSVGLIKKMRFAVPQPSGIDEPPVWESSATPYTCTGLDQVYPIGAYPRFDQKTRTRFEGIETTGGFVDKIYALWITMNKARAFGGYQGSGRLENVYRPWWLKNFSGDLYAVFLQKFADPVTEVSYPSGKDSAGNDNQKTALDIGDLVRGGATVAVPSDTWTVTDPGTGETKITAIRRWAIEFMQAQKNQIDFNVTEDHENKQIALGYLVPPQAFIDVGGGQLGGPTSADVLAGIAQETLLLDAADLDTHINKYVFVAVDSANFQPGTPPVRIRTTGLDKIETSTMFELIKVLLGRSDVDPSVYDVGAALERLKQPTKKPASKEPVEPGEDDDESDQDDEDILSGAISAETPRDTVGRWTTTPGAIPSGARSIKAMAGVLHQRAKEVEPVITKMVVPTVRANGGKMSGMANRVKEPVSIESKIKRDAIEMSISHRDAAHGITDTIRYTAVLPHDKLVSGALATQKALADGGFVQYDTKWRNYWKPGNDYHGYNCVFVNPKSGMRFELQFHTPQSIKIKKTNHKLYKVAREMPEGQQRHALITRMRKNWETVTRPAGWENLPGVVISQ